MFRKRNDGSADRKSGLGLKFPFFGKKKREGEPKGQLATGPSGHECQVDTGTIRHGEETVETVVKTCSEPVKSSPKIIKDLQNVRTKLLIEQSTMDNRLSDIQVNSSEPEDTHHIRLISSSFEPRKVTEASPMVVRTSLYTHTPSMAHKVCIK